MKPVKINVKYNDVHPAPDWRNVVAIDLGGMYAPIAMCGSPERAEIVAEALRRLAAADPERLREAVLAAKQSEIQIARLEAGQEEGQ
jgi:hypothetical protein